jgi:hypothetical protein
MDYHAESFSQLLSRCYAQAVLVAVEHVLVEDVEADPAFARQAVSEQYPIIEKLESSPGIHAWIMADLAKGKICINEHGEDSRLLLNQAFRNMAKTKENARYESAKFVLEFVSCQYEACGFKL